MQRDLPPAIIELDHRLDALIGDTFREGEPPLLYHLTGGIDAVDGILSKGVMRATISMSVRGDEEELLAGERLAEEVARRMLASTKSAVSRTALQAFVGGFGTERISSKAEVFVICFTPEIGSVHWERYADEGRGFAIGFPVLADRQRSCSDALLLNMRVYYEPDVVRTRLREAFSRALGLAEAANKKCRRFDPAVRLAKSTLYRIAALAAVQTKRRKFEDENEWRIVAIPMPEALDQVVRGGVRPFFPVALNMDKQPVVSVVLVGPNHPAPEAAAIQVREILESYGYPAGVPVSHWKTA